MRHFLVRVVFQPIPFSEILVEDRTSLCPRRQRGLHCRLQDLFRSQSQSLILQLRQLVYRNWYHCIFIEQLSCFLCDNRINPYCCFHRKLSYNNYEQQMALPKLIDQAHRITLLTGDVNYTFIHFIDAPQLVICKTLKECTEILQDFIRVHKRYTVNPKFIEKVMVAEHEKASVLVGGRSVPISRRRNKEVLMRLWQNQEIWQKVPAEKVA